MQLLCSAPCVLFYYFMFIFPYHMGRSDEMNASRKGRPQLRDDRVRTDMKRPEEDRRWREEARDRVPWRE